MSAPEGCVKSMETNLSLECGGEGEASMQNVRSLDLSTQSTPTPLGKVFPTADVITSHLRHITSHSQDVRVMTGRHHAAVLSKVSCTPSAATSVLHVVPSTIITSSVTTVLSADPICTITVTATITAATATTTTSSAINKTSTFTTTSLPDVRVTSAFNSKEDWREAAKQSILTVKCKKTVAELHKSRFGSGSRGKCIKLNKEWFTPTEFEVHCGRSASKDWKRSIRFQKQSLYTLIEDGFLEMHATSCACSACLHSEEADRSVRLHRPVKRKRRKRLNLNVEKVLKQGVASTQQSTVPTASVTLPVSDLEELAVIPSLVLGPGTHCPPATLSTPLTRASPTTPQATTSFASLSLDKAWEHMNQVLVGLERSVSQAHILLEELKERTRQETLNLRQKLLQEKEEAVAQAKIEAQLSNMAKPSEGFLVQVRDDDGNQSLQPIMLDSLISSVPALNPTPSFDSEQKKCVTCSHKSAFECSGCQTRAYCSPLCQRQDWPSHQGVCGRSSPTQEDTLNSASQPAAYIYMLSD